jgi:hypothetical protein
MKLRKKKSDRKNSKASSASDKTRTKSVLQTRRVVKATPPPEGIPAPVEMDSLTDLDSSSERERSRSAATPVIFQDEALAEKTRQWRQDRLDASAATRKEHKEKEIMEHRLRSKSSDEGNVHVGDADAGADADAERVEQNKENIPKALSVSSKFPEHKRKARTDDHEAGKKPRSEVVDGENENDEEEQEGKDAPGTWRSKATEMIKASAPGVAVAIAAILAVRFLRPR